MANIKFNPSWKKYEQDLKSSDRETSLKASEKFESERTHEIQTDNQAKRWEEGRKAELARLKPQWAKKMESSKPLDPLQELRKFGSFETNFTPVEGYLIIEVDNSGEKTTASGLIIKSEKIENSGIVLKVGNDVKVYSPTLSTILAPCRFADHILFKRGAGVEIDIKGKHCRLIQFGDVLGVFDD